jgi:hypothetical protein
MNYFDKDIFNDFKFQEDEQNTESQIWKVEAELAIKFPEEYRSIFKLYNGGSGEIGEYYIDLWSLEDIVDFYEENMGEESKDLVVFASDGCGMAYAFKKGNAEIRFIPMDSLEYEYSKICSDNFYQFIQDMYLGKLKEY